MKKFGAFTLIEMLAVILLSSIVLMLGVPSFHAVIQNNRAVSMTSDFIRSVNFARSKALEQSASVSVCAAASADLNSCGNASQWVNGWLIFVDVNGNGAYDANTDTLLTTHAGLNLAGSISAPAASITYRGSGFLQAGAGTFTFAPQGCRGNHARNVNIANNGRISVSSAPCPT